VYTATYTVPSNQTITRLQFRSTKGTNDGFGNFLDGISITRDTENCDPPPVYVAACAQLDNVGFEESVVDTTTQQFRIADAGLVLGWDTSAKDNMIEQWVSGFKSVPAYEGNQFAELNANEIAALYQDFATTPGAKVTLTFAHRGREGVDEAVLEMGVPGQKLTTVATMSTSKDNWKVYTATYTVPANQTITRLQFRSLTQGSVGNFLDGISASCG
jgi:hypothetical protein